MNLRTLSLCLSCNCYRAALASESLSPLASSGIFSIPVGGFITDGDAADFSCLINEKAFS